MKKTLLLLIILSSSLLCNAQFVKKRAINAQIGYGLSIPYESVDDTADSGFFLQGEYVLTIKSWFELKPYVGLILTNPKGEDLNGNPTDEFAITKAGLLGGKFRLRAPIPWVAPYIETGFGLSIGKFETQTAFISKNKSGLQYHIPVAFGLELGKETNVDIGFTYYVQPQVEQVVGAFALGITIPLKDK
ncbi:MAG: hypothetical protein CMC76_04550 [Flavobacteriaceae bacterium]|nr:hypothetical protein [Flavobacteriaceae bacterium]